MCLSRIDDPILFKQLRGSFDVDETVVQHVAESLLKIRVDVDRPAAFGFGFGTH